MTINLDDYRQAPSGLGPLAYDWSDKPHRLLYDLIVEVERLRAREASTSAALDDLERTVAFGELIVETRSEAEPQPPNLLTQRYDVAPPIVKTAIKAILTFEDTTDDMGYDLSYYQEDLPRVVTEAIAPWKAYDDGN